MPIRFMPTYKREIDSNTYVNKKDQCPSYTDRILIKNNSQCQLAIKEYGCYENYWGSDHRPVYTHVNVVTQPQHYVDPVSLLSPKSQELGHGELKFLHTMLAFNANLLNPILRERYRFPLFFQLHFRSDWLLAKSYSSQKRLGSSTDDILPKQWKESEVPVLYTPINSIEILRQKRLTIVV